MESGKMDEQSMKGGTTERKYRHSMPPEHGSWRVWVMAVVGCVAVFLLLPAAWRQHEPVPDVDNLRMPYALSRDYWLYQRWMRHETQRDDDRSIYVLGDSVVWGEFVDRNGTLSAFLNRHQNTDSPHKFINAGINGLYPLALEGLAAHWLPELRGRRVLLQANLLWMSNPQADLQLDKEQSLNHTGLLPQFAIKVGPYRADFDTRVSVLVRRAFDFPAWTSHLQIAYFDNRSPQDWSVTAGSGWPPDYPNARKNPLSQIRFEKLLEPSADPDRGTGSSRHRPWNKRGMSVQSMAWVSPSESNQFRAMKRLVEILVGKGADVFVAIGPLNRHMMDAESVAVLDRIELVLLEELGAQGVRAGIMTTLPSDEYADASHPLTDGYSRLARQLMADDGFLKWLD